MSNQKLTNFNLEDPRILTLVQSAAEELHTRASNRGAFNRKKAISTHKLGVLLHRAKISDLGTIAALRNAYNASHVNEGIPEEADGLQVWWDTLRIAEKMEEVGRNNDLTEFDFAELRDFCHGLDDAIRKQKKRE